MATITTTTTSSTSSSSASCSITPSPSSSPSPCNTVGSRPFPSAEAGEDIFSSSKPDTSIIININNSKTDNFPIGLRVLVVDDDPICLLILDRMLRRCQYQVTTYGKATEALAMLRENRDSFDVIISDVCMPDMDGFKLLELVGLEMDLPVIMMSANGETSAVMKGIKHGACDYLLKPVRMEELRNIWQHVVRKKWRNTGLSCSNEDERVKQVSDDGDYNSLANEGTDGSWKQSKKRKDVKEEDEDLELDNDDPSTTKKPRVVWSVDLHQQFVGAVNQLGIDKAVPKRILELMNVQGLTRENVASHLQKYRLYLKRISGGAGHPSGGVNPPFPTGTIDPNFGSVSAANLASLNELRAITGSGPLSPQSLVSTLQSGLLGRLGSPNNIKVDPSILLQLAAFQNSHNGGLTSRSQVLPTYNSQPLLTNQGGFQPGVADVTPAQPTNFGTYEKETQQKLVADQHHQLLSSQLHQVLGNQQEQPPQVLVNQASFRTIGQLAGVTNNNSSSNSSLLNQAFQQQQGSKSGSPIMQTTGTVAQPGLTPTVEMGTWVGGVSNVNTACIPLAVSTPPASSGFDLSFSNEGIVHKFGSKVSALKQSEEPNWQLFQNYGQITSNGPVQNPSHKQNLSLGVVGLEQDQSCCSTGFCLDNNNARYQAVQLDNFPSEDSLKVKEEGHDWLPEQVSDELLSMVFKQVRS